MTTKQLRNKILDLAIHGKLVKQDANDEPASTLLARIRAEKEQLVADGKLKKKDLASTPISDEDKPFEVPEGWEWVTVGEIAFVTKLAGFEYTEYIADNLCGNEGIPLFKGKNVQDGKIIYEFEGYIPETISDELSRSQITRPCLLTPYVGTIGNIGLHNKNGKFHLGSNVGKIEILCPDQFLDLVNPFLLYYLRSTIGLKQLSKHKKSTAQESISIQAIRDVFIPLPPLAEQQRIVAAVEQWMSLIDIIESGKENLQQSIALAKNKILDLAIKGKLVEKEGEWEEKTLGEVCKIKGGKRIPKGKSFSDEPTNHAYIRVTNMKNHTIVSNDIKYIDDSVYELIKNYTISSSDLYLTIAGTIGDVGEVPEEFDMMNLTENAAKLTDITCDKKYLMYCLLSNPSQDHFSSKFHQVAQPKLSIETAKTTLIPLPPLAEQQRIVAKIEDLFTQLNIIANALK